MARLATTSLKQMSEINLTPLMDLTFILLITFIITFPLIEQGIQVDLPKGEATELSPEKARTITIDRTGRLFLDDAPVEFEFLEQTMQEVGESGGAVSVLIRADQNVVYREVVRILRVLHDANITSMALVTRADE